MTTISSPRVANPSAAAARVARCTICDMEAIVGHHQRVHPIPAPAGVATVSLVVSPRIGAVGRSRATTQAGGAARGKRADRARADRLGHWRAAAANARRIALRRRAGGVHRQAPARVLLHPRDDAVHHVHCLVGVLAGGRLGREHHRIRPVEHWRWPHPRLRPGWVPARPPSIPASGWPPPPACRAAAPRAPAASAPAAPPRAAVPPRDLARHHHRIRHIEDGGEISSSACGFSIFTRMPARPAAMACASATSSGRCTKDSPIQSTPWSRAKAMSARSFAVSAGMGSTTSGHVHALAVGQRAAHQHFGIQEILAHAQHPQAQLAIVEQQGGADAGGGDDLGMRQVDAPRIARCGVEIQPEGLPGLQMHPPALKTPQPQLRPLHISQDADRAAGLRLQRADGGNSPAMRPHACRGWKFRRNHIRPGVEQPGDHLWCRGGGAEGGDDFRPPVAPDGDAVAIVLSPPGWPRKSLTLVRVGPVCSSVPAAAKTAALSCRLSAAAGSTPAARAAARVAGPHQAPACGPAPSTPSVSAISACTGGPLAP